MNQRRLLQELYAAQRWRRVQEIADEMEINRRICGCALKGLHIRKLVRIQQQREFIEGSSRTEFRRYYQISRAGELLHEELTVEEAERQTKSSQKEAAPLIAEEGGRPTTNGQ